MKIRKLKKDFVGIFLGAVKGKRYKTASLPNEVAQKNISQFF
jgi:hypothetical protein